MTQLNEAKVCLCVSGQGIDGHEVSRRLILPKSAATDPARPGPCCGKARLLIEAGSWTLVAPRSSPEDMDHQVRQLLDPLTTDMAVWEDLARRYDVHLICAFQMASAIENMSISAETFRLLGARGIGLVASIYTRRAADAADGDIDPATLDD
ncbi:DUF4279 domain-containing protein [Oceaniglobus roseus]|uniref:DUF4279 domain-containing protein n=1 Tax=Oceaniglobus roseus TaxID=1737570 RepID=UPI000C7F1940|nr:DUF4279 domain-containing protein [Kandeliimicrobium roseum]